MKNTKNAWLLKLLIVIVIIVSVYILYQSNWSGFAKGSNKSVTIEEIVNPKDGKIIKLKKETENFQSGKTLWDWLGLTGTIAIPIMIYRFQLDEQRRALKLSKDEKDAAEQLAKDEKDAAEQLAKDEKEIADTNLREDALQAYIDRMSDILTNKECCSELFLDKNNINNANINNPVRDVVRVRTTTILRRLENDVKRQEEVLNFLRDAELFDFILSDAHLNEANLSGIHLSEANLSNTRLNHANLSNTRLNHAHLSSARLYHADLSSARLFRANLKGAKLISANLSNAYFKRANLSNARLTSANLSNADLYRANLSGANLINANLSNADISYANFTNIENLTVEQIKAAKSWKKAKYDPEFRLLLGLPPET